LRMAALCHDIGHLPFSHAAEKELLPAEYDHERLTKELIYSPEMRQIWESMTPPLRPDDIVKLAVGPKKADTPLNNWEAVLAEIIIGDAFGADRMDYLLRDSYHAGVAYGTFDHHRLINTLRILPAEYQESDEPALGLEDGGLESSEGLMLARHFMYQQVYFHPIRRAYDIHLKDFLAAWLRGEFFPLFALRPRILAQRTANSHDELNPESIFAFSTEPPLRIRKVANSCPERFWQPPPRRSSGRSA
jgi:HD superfamily phosphohydrolase